MEIARDAGGTHVRDSKAPTAGQLAFGEHQFRRFRDAVEAGFFDR